MKILCWFFETTWLKCDRNRMFFFFVFSNAIAFRHTVKINSKEADGMSSLVTVDMSGGTTRVFFSVGCRWSCRWVAILSARMVWGPELKVIGLPCSKWKRTWFWFRSHFKHSTILSECEKVTACRLSMFWLESNWGTKEVYLQRFPLTAVHICQ